MIPDMRHLMRLVESSTSEVWPEEAYDLISGYVTHGSVTEPGQFDPWFERMLKLLPRPRSSKTLMRVLNLNDEQLAAVQTDGLNLELRRFQSWTKSTASLERLVYDRDKGVLPVVIKEIFPPSAIVVDVVAFYRQWHMTSSDFPEWSRYVLPENEIIVQHDGAMRITTSMLVPQEYHTLSEAPPKAGDTFTSGGTRERIRSLADPEEQPGHGLYAVIVAPGGEMAHVRRNRQTGKWIEVER